jgi:hypothetical protein
MYVGRISVITSVILVMGMITSCRSVPRYQSSAASLRPGMSSFLCKRAITIVDGYAVWRSDYDASVVEAKSHSLTLEYCAKLTHQKVRGSTYVTKQKDSLERQAVVAREAEAERIRIAKIEQARKQLAEERRQREKERGRKLEVERQRKTEAERIRLAKLEQTKKQKAEERRLGELVRKRKIANAREKSLAPLRIKNGRSFAVIIGNKNYGGDVPAVDFAHNDADAMRQFVLEQLGYRPGNIHDLRDATRNDMAKFFGDANTHEGRLFNMMKEGTSDVIVYYSGHGVPGSKGKRSYLLPVNGDPNLPGITGYPVDILYKNLAKLPARSVTVFLDACFSGNSERGMLISSASGLGLEPDVPKVSNRLTVVTAAQGNQLANWDRKARHGLFTKHLLDALNGKADSKGYGNSDGKVSLAEVKSYLADEMTYQARFAWNRTQNAYISGAANTVLSTVLSPQ